MTRYRMTDIENFVSTCGCRTINEAARKLGISQPALSESIKRLEKDVDLVLFYRSRTGIQLTPSGKWLLEKSCRVLQALDELEVSQDSISIFAGRTIQIGCHPAVAQYVMPNALSYIAKRAPDYKVKLHHALSRDIQLDVQRGVLDVGVVINAAQVPDLVIKKIGVDTVHVFASQGAFDGSTVICNTAMFQTQHILRKWKNRPLRMIETESLELICRLVETGLGYGIIPRRAVDLARIPLATHANLPTYKDTLSLIYRPEFGLNKAEKLVCEAIRNSG